MKTKLTTDNNKWITNKRPVRANKALVRTWSPEQLKVVLDPRYDVIALREHERPGRK